MSHFKKQQGIGLIEVMVSLLLLAIAVLGFSAMQMQSVKATDESLMRSDGLNAMRNLSEDIRLNPDTKAYYQEQVNGVWSGLAAAKKNSEGFCEAVATYKTDKSLATKACVSGTSCTAEEQANYNAYQSMQTACDAQMMMNMVDCPGTDKACIIVSWSNTVPEMSTANNACAKTTGDYNRGTNCLILEAY